jgi:hypothetical protein
MRDDAIPLKVRKRVYDEFNVVLKPKNIQNIKQKVIGKDVTSFTYNWYSIKTCCNLGLPRDEWKNTVELLDAFVNDQET